MDGIREKPLPKIPGVMNPLTAAILVATASNPRPTMRSIAAEVCGGISTSTVLWHLLDLREMGLVTWIENRNGTLKATVRWFSPYADTATTES